MCVRHLLICLALLLGVVLPCAADTIYLTNNQTRVGIIDPDTLESEKLTVKTPLGVVQIPRSKILRIERDGTASYTEISGDLAASDRNLDRAMELYQKALENDPNNVKLKKKIADLRDQIQARDQQVYGEEFNRIRGLISEKKYTEAIDSAKRIQSVAKQDSVKDTCRQLISHVYLTMARGFRDQINMTEAEKYYSLAMQTYPDSPVSHLELADLLRSLSAAGKTQAIPLYQRGIELAMKKRAMDGGESLDETRLLEYRFTLGKMYLDDKKYREAAALFIDITRDDKNFSFPEAVNYAVDAYYKIQSDGTSQTANLDQVVDNLKAIIGLKPHEQRALFLLGRIYYRREDWKNARDLMQAAVENTQDGTPKQVMAEALLYLGTCHRKLNDVPHAAEVFQRLIAMQPNNYDATCELAEIRMEQAVYQEAFDLSQQAISIDKDKYRAYLVAGLALQKLKRYEEARQSLREVVTRDPTNFEAQLAIGRTLYDQGQWEPTNTEVQRVVDMIEADAEKKQDPKVKPLLAEAYTLMGTANYNLKNYARSREIYQMALKIDPQYADALEGIGKTHQSEGHHIDAQDFFEKAIRSNPNKPDYYLSRAINFHDCLKSPEKALPFYLEYLKHGGKDPRVKGWIVDCGGNPPK